MPKDSQTKHKHNGSNRDTPSADMANQPGHSANYHKSAGEDQKSKK